MSNYRGTIRFINESKNVAIVNQENVSANFPETAIIGIGDGIGAQFFGTLTPVVEYGDVVFKVDETAKTASVNSSGVISGADIDSGGINQINLTTGACAICFSGTPGTPSYITGSVDLSSGINLSDGPYTMTIAIDGKTYYNINFGESATTSLEDICNKINELVGYSVASNDGSGHLYLEGTSAKAREDIVCTGNAATTFGVDGASTPAASPSGAIPAKGDVVSVAYETTYADITSSVFTIVKGDFSSVAVNDTINYSFSYTVDPNKDDKEIVIS